MERDEAENDIQHDILRSLVDLSETDELLDDSYISTHIAPQNSIHKFGKDFMSIPILRECSVANKSDEFIRYLTHIKTRGEIFYKDMAKEILKMIKNDEYVSHHNSTKDEREKDTEKEGNTKNVTVNLKYLGINFTDNIQTYFDSLVLLKTHYDIDEEYVFLDILGTASILMRKDLRKVFEDLPALNYNTQITNTINKHIKILKKEELRYICNQYRVCRPYSLLTDYFERFLDEVLVLPIPKYETVIDFLGAVIQTDEDYEELVEGALRVAKVVEYFFDTPSRSYEYMQILKSFLIQRNKIVQVKDTALKLRMQSFRTLMELLDGAFYCNSSDNFFNVFNGTLNVVRNFAATENDIDAQTNVMDFISFILKSINYSKDPMDRVLFQAFITGKVSDQQLYYTLFKDGAKGVYM